MKYSLIFVLLFAATLILAKPIFAQIQISPEISQQISTIDPLIAQEANRHTCYVELCPTTHNPLIGRCFGGVIADDTLSPFTTTKPSGFGPAEFRKAKKTQIVAIVDVSADADPTSGAAVYDSVKYNNKKGWFKIGGTSLSSPLVAGIFATDDN